jgi:hypothetical protein
MGDVISELIVDTPNYISGIICVISGLVIGETFMYMKWSRQKITKLIYKIILFIQQEKEQTSCH